MMTSFILTRAGARLAVDPTNLDFYCLVKLRNGVWEEDVLNACLRILQPGDVFYDIGANAGIITLDVAKSFGEGVAIHSFEPQPTLARSLKISIALNEFRNVELHEMLLGEQQGAADFFIADHAIHSSLVSREAGAIRIECPMQTIDGLVARSLPAPTVIKIDVEGAELLVLRGGQQTFQALPPVIIFEADDNMMRFGYSHADLFGLLEEFAEYTFHRIEGSHWHVVDEPGRAELGNYIAVPPGRNIPVN